MSFILAIIGIIAPFIVLPIVFKALNAHKSSTNKTLFGICGGLADATGISVILIRIIMVVLVLFFGVGFWWYVVAIFTMPR